MSVRPPRLTRCGEPHSLACRPASLHRRTRTARSRSWPNRARAVNDEGMPKKKKRRSAGSSGPQGRPQRPRHSERQELQAGFELWLSSSDGAAPARIIGTLLDLKAEHFDSPDPTLWTEEVTVELMTEIVPRKILQTRQDAMDLVPALRLFFEFLRARGRWNEDSMSSPVASTLLAGLEFTVLEAVDDPSRRSFSSNILTYGLEHGLDPEDEDALAAYMEWYNSLPHAHRVELSDRGRISDPAISYAPSRAPPAHHEAHGISFVAGDGHGDARRGAAADDAPPSWPWFLPDTDIDLERIRDWRSEEHTSELQSRGHLVCRLLLEKQKEDKQRHKATAQVET